MTIDDRDPADPPASLAPRPLAAKRLRQIADILGVPMERFFEPPGSETEADHDGPSLPERAGREE